MRVQRGLSGIKWGAALACGALACSSTVVAAGSNSGAAPAQVLPAPTCPGTASFAAAVAGARIADGLFDAGSNGAGQLGSGSLGATDSLQQISLSPPPEPGANQVAAGDDFAVASDPNGIVYAWGDNADGQLGDGTTTSSSSPVIVRLPQGVSASSVAAGGNFALMIGSDNNLYAWGDGSAGQLGNGSTTGSTVPTEVPLPLGVSPGQIVAGSDFALMIDGSGKVWAWGDNTSGQLGLGTTSASVSQPTSVTMPPGVTAYAVAAGDNFALMIGSDNNLYAWGANAHGQLGDKSTSPSTTAVKVLLPSGVAPNVITAGADFALAAGSDGNLYAWGANTHGQLGDGNTSSSTTPVVSLLPQGVSTRDISAGTNFTMALGDDCNLYAWGDNAQGQLGLGDHTSRSTPSPVSLPQALTPTFLPEDNLGSSSYVLVRPQAPVVTQSSATSIAGHPFALEIPVVASPGPAFQETGPLPPGITLSGSGLLSGTPAEGSGGVYPVELTVSNGVAPNAVVRFTLTVDEAPRLLSTSPTTVVVGRKVRLKLKATGTPPPVFSAFGHLPKGLRLTPSGVLVGRPRPAAVGSSVIGVVAANGLAPNALEAISLTVVRKAKG